MILSRGDDHVYVCLCYNIILICPGILDIFLAITVPCLTPTFLAGVIFTLFFLQASKLTMIWTSIVCPGIFCPDLYTGAVYLTAALSVTFETERLIIAFRFMLDPSWTCVFAKLTIWKLCLKSLVGEWNRGIGLL